MTSTRRELFTPHYQPPSGSSVTPTVVERKLGRTGLKLFPVGFGCMVTSDASVLDRAVDLGVNHFDTARVYQRGNNEAMVGAALKDKRKRLVISSKTLASDRAGAMEHLEESLKALRTDYLDIWYLHDKRAASGITDELMEAQQAAKKQGKIRFAGVSLHTAHAEVVPAAIRAKVFDVVLLTYNFATGDRWNPLLQSLSQAGIGVVAMKVMAGSFGIDPSYDYRKSRQTLHRQGASLAALKWVLRNPNVHCAIPSMTDTDQLEENVRAAREPFQESDHKTLADQLQRIRPLYCRMCGDCGGVCPKGVPVPDVLRCLMYADGYGQFPLARQEYLSLPARAHAVGCGECVECTMKCPHGVHIAERVKRASELFA